MEGKSRAGKKKLKSWQRRRLRRIKLVIKAAFICVLFIVFIALIRGAMPYEAVDLCDYVIYEYSGYNNRGSVSVSMNEELVSRLMQRLLSSYDNKLIHYRKCTPEDYNAFYNSLSVYTDTPDNLSNGSRFTFIVSYDKELAKKIRLDVTGNKREIVVEGLTNAAVISLDTLFEGISFEFDGVSPELTASFINNTTNPYLLNTEFVVEGNKEYYSDGDVIRVRAYVNEEECVEKHFMIDAEPDDRYKDFIVSGDSGYLNDASFITKEFLDEAVSHANSAFTSASANEYGVRVYFEANAEPVYVNKKSTFEWKSYSVLSAYFKAANSDDLAASGKEHNMLDIVYDGVISQADGKAVSVEAVVRFRNIIKNADGSLTYDFSNPSIVSCSHVDSRIKKNIITNYEDDYTISKLSLNSP